jgi:hypothetical protein
MPNGKSQCAMTTASRNLLAEALIRIFGRDGEREDLAGVVELREHKRQRAALPKQAAVAKA